MQNLISTETSSQTAMACEQAALFGATPGRDEFDNREIWNEEEALAGIEEAIHILAGAVAPDGTQLADERESLLWGFVNALHAQVQRLDRGIDKIAPEMKDLGQEQDGSEIKSRELELLTDRVQNLGDRRDAFETMRDLAAEGYRAETGDTWRPRHGSHSSQTGKLTSAAIDARDYMRARKDRETSAQANSTGRRNTFSLTGLQALVQSFGGSSPSEGLAGPCIERVSNNCEYVRTVCAQIGSFREVLSKQSIGVLVRSALPRAVRFAEVDGKAGCDPQIRMPGHLCSLVPGQRAAKLRWQCRDRPGDGIANRFSPMTGKRRPVLHARDGAVAFHSGKMQQHCEPRGAFHQSADRRSAQADDQVTFPVSGYGPISCFRRSFTDHDLRRDEGFAPPAATCPRHAQCPSRAKAGGQLTTECAAALYVERLIDRLMTDPHRLILGPVPRIVDPKTVRDLLRTPGPGPSPVLPRPMPTTVPDDAWPLDHRSIRCRDPTRKPILHIAPQRLIRCQLGWLRPFGGSISMPLRRRCSVVQATASGRRVAPHLAGDRRRCSLQPASNMTYASSLGAQKSNLLTFLERQVTS